MKSKGTHCVLQSGLSPEEKAALAARLIDPGAGQAFRNLRFQAEELALELAVRLRVLGKSLAAGCRKADACPGKAYSYQKLRQQLESFLDQRFSEPHLPMIRHFVVNCLPPEPNSCTGGDNHCPIQQVETAIALLSEDIYDQYGLAGAPAQSFSL